MGIFQKLFGSGKKQVSPDKMAHVVLDAAVDLAVRGKDSVRGLLRSVGVEVANEVRYQGELIAYQLFLLDVIVNRTFGDQADRIRERIRERFADLAVRVAREAGVEPNPREEYIAYLESRFQEYTPALRRSMGSQGQPEHGAFELPDVVYQNITGREEANPAAKTALAAQWPTVFEDYGKALQEYEVVADK